MCIRDSHKIRQMCDDLKCVQKFLLLQYLYTASACQLPTSVQYTSVQKSGIRVILPAHGHAHHTAVPECPGVLRFTKLRKCLTIPDIIYLINAYHDMACDSPTALVLQLIHTENC